MTRAKRVRTRVRWAHSPLWARWEAWAGRRILRAWNDGVWCIYTSTWRPVENGTASGEAGAKRAAIAAARKRGWL